MEDLRNMNANLKLCAMFGRRELGGSAQDDEWTMKAASWKFAIAVAPPPPPNHLSSISARPNQYETCGMTQKSSAICKIVNMVLVFDDTRATLW